MRDTSLSIEEGGAGDPCRSHERALPHSSPTYQDHFITAVKPGLRVQDLQAQVATLTEALKRIDELKPHGYAEAFRIARAALAQQPEGNA